MFLQPLSEFSELSTKSKCLDGYVVIESKHIPRFLIVNLDPKHKTCKKFNKDGMNY